VSAQGVEIAEMFYRVVQYDKAAAVAAALDLMEAERVAAVVGGGSSSISTTAQRLLRLANVPQVAYTSTSPLLSNKEKFPTFSRVVAPDTFQGPALAELCFSQNWTNVGLISTTDVYATELANSFTKAMEEGGGKIVDASVLIWNEAVSAQGVEIAIRSMKKSGVRIIALLVANDDAAKDVLAEATRQGLAGPSYVYVGGDATMDEKTLVPRKADETPEFMSLVREAAEGAVGLVPYLTRSGPAYEEFL
jgi:ABC-type branched-subunit amino acid transport system substrate-binding protein